MEQGWFCYRAATLILSLLFIFAAFMDIHCSPQELYILEKVALAAEALGVETYLVGGFVRDKLLDRPTTDADIVCIGDGIELAKATAKYFTPVPQVNYFKNFGTAHIRVNIGDTAADTCFFDIEFVGARKESYRAESRNPDVLPGTLSDDQLRRDFTINAMAINLNKNAFGKLVDPFNGTGDLAAKIIQTPLEASRTFSDDPLR